jgi:glycosyltransferase involved in cell wall biosynthesis
MELGLSLVVPVYNEERRVERGLSEIARFLGKQDYLWELVVVDDGSSDRTISKIKEQISKVQIKSQKERGGRKVRVELGSNGIATSSRRSSSSFRQRRTSAMTGKEKGWGSIRLVHMPENRGKGGALKEGFERARGKYIVFSDIDLSVSIAELPKLLEGLKKFDVVIGSRRAEGAKIVRHQPWLREQLGRVFTWLVSKPLGLEVSDATCGFKGFRASAGRKLFGASQVSGWAYDAEILYLARKWGYSVKEVPVAWRNDEQTRVRLWRDVVGSGWGIVRILVNDWMGKYG